MKTGESYTIIRRKPVNLQERDANIFNTALSYEVPAPEVLELKGAEILKEMIFNPRSCSFVTRYTHLTPVPFAKKAKRLLWLLKPSQKIDRGIWVTHEWTSEYFHWIMDALCRLMIVPQSVQAYPLLLPDFYAGRPYILQSLELLGIEYRFYPMRKRVHVGHLVVPGHVALTGNYNEDLIRRLRDRFLTRGFREVMPWRKIYVSRKMAAKRQVLNEGEVADAVKTYGYEVHYFEQYNLAEQICLMHETKVIAGLHGAGLTNMLFMPEGGQVLEIRNPADIKNNCYFSLASALNHHYFYLRDSEHKGQVTSSGITVDIACLGHTLEQMESFSPDRRGLTS